MVATKWYSALITNGGNAVDVFFLLSGLLATYTTIRKLRKMKMKYGNWRFWAGYVLNRYLRITPMLLLTAYFGWMIAPLLYDGPLNSYVTAMWDTCKSGKGYWCHLTVTFSCTKKHNNYGAFWALVVRS